MLDASAGSEFCGFGSDTKLSLAMRETRSLCGGLHCVVHSVYRLKEGS